MKWVVLLALIGEFVLLSWLLGQQHPYLLPALGILNLLAGYEVLHAK